MSRLMRGVMTSYSMYFNRKYHHTGHLFESSYRASRVSTDQYLLHISRYIHLNPKNWRTYPYSSLTSYTNAVHRDWVSTAQTLDLYSSGREYMKFLEDYETTRDELAIIKNELANNLRSLE